MIHYYAKGGNNAQNPTIIVKSAQRFLRSVQNSAARLWHIASLPSRILNSATEWQLFRSAAEWHLFFLFSKVSLKSFGTALWISEKPDREIFTHRKVTNLPTSILYSSPLKFPVETGTSLDSHSLSSRLSLNRRVMIWEYWRRENRCCCCGYRACCCCG